VAPIQPEKVQTIEFGYRGTLMNNRLFIDASYYFSRYIDFIGYQIGAELRFSPQFPDQLIAAQAYRVAANAQDVVTTQGFSAGLNYFFEKGYSLNGNYSWNVLNTQSDDPIIPAFNTPAHKFNVGVSGRDVTWFKVKHMGFSVNYKWIQGFVFEGSPQFSGSIPTYYLLDAQVTRTVPKIHTSFKLGASNLTNNKVFQLYGGPRVGRLIYFTVQTDLTDL
jgi:outer membrane receptor protein involved in Fe transport